MKKLMTLFAFIAFGTAASYAEEKSQEIKSIEIDVEYSCGYAETITVPANIETSHIMAYILRAEALLCG